MFQQWPVFERLTAGQNLATFVFLEDFSWESGTPIQVQQDEKARELLPKLRSAIQIGWCGVAICALMALDLEYNLAEAPVFSSAK